MTVVESMAKQAISQQQLADNEQEVVDYIRNNPDFFIKHESLLKDIKLPHQSGKAISLGERQVQVFREQRDGLQARLNELVAIAHENDQHFEKSKRLLLNLMDARSLDEVVIVLGESFRNDFNIPSSCLLVFGDATDYPASDMAFANLDEVRDTLGSLLDSTRAVCGQFSDAQLACLFAGNTENVGSAAVIPIRQGEVVAMLSLGSDDERYFDSSMGSLFLSYISDFISRILPELLLKAQSKKRMDSVPSLLD